MRPTDFCSGYKKIDLLFLKKFDKVALQLQQWRIKMASKTSKRANAAAAKNAQIEVEGQKDDGTRWIVVSAESGNPIYGTTGVAKFEANRLARGLVHPAEIKQVG